MAGQCGAEYIDEGCYVSIRDHSDNQNGMGNAEYCDALTATYGFDSTVYGHLAFIRNESFRQQLYDQLLTVCELLLS